MASTPYSGKSGSIQTNALTAANANVTSWSVSITDSTPATAHSNSSGWVDSFLGVKSWSASMDILLDAAGAQVPPAIGSALTSIQLFDGHWKYIATGGIVSGASYSCDIAGGGLMSASISVSGSQALTIQAA